MMPLAVQFYDVVLFVHISAVVLAFGPTFGYALIQMTAERTDPRAIPTIMRGFSMIDRYMVTGGTLVLLAAGIYLTIDRWEFGDVFVGIGILVVIVLLGLLHGFFLPHERKLAALAERDAANSPPGEVVLSDEYWATSKRVGQIGTLVGVIVILTIYFMTAKPFL